MSKYILPVSMMLLILVAKAQVTEKFTVRAGEDISKTLASYGMYRLPAFVNGTVTFKDKSTAGGKMNYNIYLGEVQFIDAKGDTLSIANPETIDSIAIDSNLFYYKKGYLQVVANYNAIRLVMKQKIEFRPVKIGAYGNQSPGNSIESYGKTSTSPYVNNNQLTINEDIIVLKSTHYFLSYQRYREVEANRRGFLSVFPAIKNKVDEFIDTNKIEFNKEADLKRLLAFCVAQ
jgi:hypothetical protein